MLVLTRKARQQVQIGPHITVTVLGIKGGSVRLGIEAPKNVCVLRTELAERPAADDADPTVKAAREKFIRESEIMLPPGNEDTSGRVMASAKGSLRCRAPRVDVAPVNSPYQSTGPASFVRPRRRRVAIK